MRRRRRRAATDISRAQRDRLAYRRRRVWRARLISTLSTVAFIAVAWLVVVNSPGWSRVRESFLDLSVAKDSLPAVLDGFWLNLRMLALAAVVIPVLGLGIAVLKTLRDPVYAPLRLLATAYTDLFRGIPLIILLYLIGFGVPGLRLQGVPTSPFVLGAVALVLTYSAYVAEVFRAGIESVHPSQRMAARSLGLTYGQTTRQVVLPQAVRRVVPPLLNDLVALQKDVGLISIIGAIDAVRAAQIETARAADFTPYMVAGLLFVLLAVPTVRLTDWVTARATRRQQGVSAL